MLDSFTAENKADANNLPAGGSVRGTGLSIDWQNGPLGTGADRREPNGAFVETVIEAARQRIEWVLRGRAGIRYPGCSRAVGFILCDKRCSAFDFRRFGHPMKE